MRFCKVVLTKGPKCCKMKGLKCRGHERDDPQGELFKVELAALLNSEHAMVELAQRMDWSAFEGALDAMWSDGKGRSAIDTRLMVSLHYLKYSFDLSDEAVGEGWVQNPYWQYLSGMRYFQHEVPLEASSMSRWRGRAGQAGAEELLEQTIRAGLDLKAIKASQLERVNVDTTVQEKHVRFPTDRRLYDRARERLVKAARGEGLELRQSYKRVGKILLKKQSRYAHARQMKRARRCQRKLRTILGRTIRDLERKSGGEVGPELEVLLERAKRIHAQQRHDKNKLYRVHAPEVECLSKGKAHKRYEFGVKVSVATTSKGGWHVGAMSGPGNPYDGHTLTEALKQLKRLPGCDPGHVFVDQGYRGHGYEGASEIHVDKRKPRSHRAESVEMDEEARRGRARDRPSEVRASHGAQPPVRRAGRHGQRRDERGRNELPQAAEAPGDALASRFWSTDSVDPCSSSRSGAAAIDSRRVKVAFSGSTSVV